MASFLRDDTVTGRLAKKLLKSHGEVGLCGIGNNQ